MKGNNHAHQLERRRKRAAIIDIIDLEIELLVAGLVRPPRPKGKRGRVILKPRILKGKKETLGPLRRGLVRPKILVKVLVGLVGFFEGFGDGILMLLLAGIPDSLDFNRVI